MKKLFFTAFIMSLSLSALADKHSEAEARLFPKDLLNVDGKCKGTHTYYECQFPSVPALRSSLNHFEDNLKVALDEMEENAQVLEPIAQNLEKIARETKFENSKVAGIYLAAAQELRKKLEIAHGDHSETFTNVRREIEDFRAVLAKVEAMQKEGKDYGYVQSEFAEFLFDYSKIEFDHRLEFVYLLEKNYSNVLVVQIDLKKIFGEELAEGFSDYSPHFAAGPQYFADNFYKKDNIYLEEDESFIDHLFSEKTPFQFDAISVPYVTPVAIAKAKTSYDVKKNKFVVAGKRTDLISFETHFTQYYPEEGMTAYMKKKFKAWSGRH
ncbi:MAG: hypothetical protein ACJ76H_16880 [Bacteriovoracaceae bacterium]